jgi:translation initiation factor 3 subunit M
MVSSTLVNVSEDAELRLVSLLADAAPPQLLAPTFSEACATSIAAGDISALLQNVVKDVGAVQALLLLPKEQAVAAVAILAALYQRVEADLLVQQLALPDAIVAATTTTTTLTALEATQRKILILSILYNMQPNRTIQCALLQRMLRLAGAHPSELLAPESALGSLLAVVGGDGVQLPPLVILLDSWQVDVSLRRELYQTVATTIATAAQLLPRQMVTRQRFLLLLVATYQDTAATGIDSLGLQAAREAAVGAIRDPVTLFVEQRNLLQQPAIHALGLPSSASDASSDQRLFGLLKVFQQGKIADYEAFMVQHGGSAAAVCKDYGVDPELCQRHMQILSLCSLAADHEEIPYAVIHETLQLKTATSTTTSNGKNGDSSTPASLSSNSNNAKVESWVIAAVSTGLLQAKMDQLKETVVVERCVVRHFDTDQWKALQSKLSLWKQNVGGILDSVKESRRAGHAVVN